MNINFIGNHHPISNIALGLDSLDFALRNETTGKVGFPVRTLCEFYGPTGIGKTTTAISILSRLSALLGNNQPIADLDLEYQDQDMVENVLKNSGYASNEFLWIEAKREDVKKRGDEVYLEELVDSLYTTPPHLGLLDSVAAIVSNAEIQGDIGDANMGRRAFPMGQFVRRVIRALKSNELPTSLIMLNHQYENMQTVGGAKSYTAPGGVIKNNLSFMRVRMRVPFVDYISSGESKVEGRWDDCWILEGNVEKLRTGVKNGKFQVVVVGGEGIHTGATAIVDCLALGLAKVQTGKLIMDGMDYGSIKKIMVKQRNDEELFAPFINELKANAGRDTESSEDEAPKKKTKKKGK